MTLKYLKDTAIEWMDKMFRNPGQRIQWIVTVPAIWSDAAKEIMRKAAEKVKAYIVMYILVCPAKGYGQHFVFILDCLLVFVYVCVSCISKFVHILASQFSTYPQMTY